MVPSATGVLCGCFALGRRRLLGSAPRSSRRRMMSPYSAWQRQACSSLACWQQVLAPTPFLEGMVLQCLFGLN